MDIKQLQYFVVSVNLGSFHAAADALITSQPNVSKVVKALETDLNMKLLERNRSGVRVTHDGEVIYRHAVQMLKNFQMIHEKKADQEIKSLSICKTPGIELDFFTAEFCSLPKNQMLKLKYQEDQIERILVQVHRGNFELGFLYVPRKNITVFEGQTRGKGLTFCELSREPLYLFAGPENVAYERPEITEDTIRYMKLVQQNEDMYSLHHQLKHLRDTSIYNTEKSLITYTNSNHLLIQLLKSTDYGSVGSGLIKDKYMEYGIRAIPIHGYEGGVSFGYVKRSRGELGSIAQSFVQYIEGRLNEDETSENDVSSNDNIKKKVENFWKAE